MKYILFIFTFLFFASCDSSTSQNGSGEEHPKVKNEALEKTVKDFFATYSERKDFDKFMSFYSNQAVLDDVLYGTRCEGKDSIAHFFDWNYGAIEFDTTKGFVQISKMAIGQNTASVEGSFAPFKFGGEQQDSWRFTTWLTFNEAGKIVLHVDYINYPLEMLEDSHSDDDGHNHHNSELEKGN